MAECSDDTLAPDQLVEPVVDEIILRKDGEPLGQVVGHLGDGLTVGPTETDQLEDQGALGHVEPLGDVVGCLDPLE